jgi:hypothetical protein
MILLVLFTDDVTICMKLDASIYIGSTWFYFKIGYDRSGIRVVSTVGHKPR